MNILFFSKNTPLLARTALDEFPNHIHCDDEDSLEKYFPKANLIVLHDLAGQEALARLKNKGVSKNPSHQKILALNTQTKELFQSWLLLGADVVLEYPCPTSWIKSQVKTLLDSLKHLDSLQRKISALDWYKADHQRCLSAYKQFESSISKACTPKSQGHIPENLQMAMHHGADCKISSIWGKDPSSNHHFLLLIHPITSSSLDLLHLEILSSHIPAELNNGKLPEQILEHWNSRFLPAPTEVPSMINLVLLQWGQDTLKITQAGQQYCSHFDSKNLVIVPSDCAPLGVPGIRIWKKVFPWRRDCKVLLGFTNEMPPATRSLWQQTIASALNGTCENTLNHWLKSLSIQDSTSGAYLAIASRHG